MPLVSVDELDVAVREGKVRLGAINSRMVRCVVCGARREPGTARRLWLDGFLRGSVCGTGFEVGHACPRAARLWL